MSTNSNAINRDHIFNISGGQFYVNLQLIQVIFKQFFQKNWLNIVLAVMLTLLVLKKDIRFSVSDSSENQASEGKALAVAESLKIKKTKQKVSVAAMYEDPTEQDDNGDGIIELLPKRAVKPVTSVKKEDANVANEFNNLMIFDAKQKNNPVNTPSVLNEKQAKCWDYVTRFVNVARAEKAKFGIPVSITLAQGLLESDAGESRLTRKANNHFGVKTFDKGVDHVVMKDDTPRDKFKKYGSAWESYRDHSQLLMRNHYKQLQFLSKTDYAGWAKGLKKAGYATDPFYAEKLIKIIESLQLYRFDEA